MFQNFGNFSFMFDRLSQPLKVISQGKQGYDDLGQPIKNKPVTIEVNEPIVNSQNPNVTYTNTDGGSYPTTTMYWQSNHGEFKKGTIVETQNGTQYQVTSQADDIGAGLFYYTLKKVGE